MEGQNEASVSVKKPINGGEARRASRLERVSSITFHDLDYQVTQRGKCCKKLPNKTILHSVR